MEERPWVFLSVSFSSGLEEKGPGMRHQEGGQSKGEPALNGGVGERCSVSQGGGFTDGAEVGVPMRFGPS